MGLINSLATISVWYRLLIVASLVWVIFTLIETDPWTRNISGLGSRNNWDEFLSVGILPVLILWGIVWIIKGIKNKPK